jgi:dTDP-4-amino-4,6-dideoxygalactose transaminase
MCPQALRRKLMAAEQEGRLPKVLVPVHFAGQPCDMADIYALSQEYGFRIIEDASHALGATYHGEPVGNCRFSDIGIFSFHPVKIITTGEGGMAVTNSSDLADRMARLATHGITRDPALMTCEPDGGWYYQQLELGHNYRMTEIQAALGLSQISRLDAYIERRHQIAQRYDRELAALPLRLPYQAPERRSALHLYPIWVDPARFDRRQVFDALRCEGIGVNIHYIPVYKQPYYQQFGFTATDFPEAERYYAGALSIPIHPALTGQEQDQVIAALTRVLQ